MKNRLVSSVPACSPGVLTASPTKSAQRLGLGVDHLHQLALAHPPQMRQREEQQLTVELVAQPAQHPLGDHAGIDVDHILEGAADQDHAEEQAA